MITVVDCNNFWSPSGGGVRRFHLEKINDFREAEGFRYVFVMHDERTWTEELNKHTIIEHVRVGKVRGKWEYRFLLAPGPLRAVFEKYQPDIIECGSPYFLPWLIRIAIRGLKRRPVLTAFWHADFPITYVERIIGRKLPRLGRLCGAIAWWYAKISYRAFDATFVSSRLIAERMYTRGMRRLCHAPMGIDTHMFNTSKRDAAKIETLKAGEPDRLTVFFPHRCCQEKGVRTLLEAWPRVVEALPLEPALIFAGTGPDLDQVKTFVEKYDHARYLGFITDQNEMAAWYASCELGLVLSGWETFCLSLLGQCHRASFWLRPTQARRPSTIICRSQALPFPLETQKRWPRPSSR